MVFGKWFGGGGKKRDDQPAEPTVDPWVDALGPMWADAWRTVWRDPQLDESFKRSLSYHLMQGKIDQARELVRSAMQFMTEESRRKLRDGNPGDVWASTEDLRREKILWADKDAPEPWDTLRLGFRMRNKDYGQSVLFHGDGHLLTVAPTGAGKGQHFILRTLLTYEGPTVVLDPKGENYRETAWRRSLFGQVFKWAPFEADSDSYNPLDFVHDWDDARLLADLVVVNSGRDLFWDTAARNLLTGLIMYVITTRPPEKRNMREVCRVLAAGQDERDDMIRMLQASDDDNLADLGNRIASQEDRLKESIYESLNAQLDVWRSKGIVATTSVTTPGFSMEEIPQVDHTGVRMAEGMGDPPGWRQKEDGTVILGSAATVYIVIPPDKIGSYRSVLRVLLGQMLKVAMRTYDDIARRAEEYPDADTDPMRRWWPMMFLLDEFPQLGYMTPIEEAISTARSYKVRLWLFAQNLSQLSRVYTNWQTIMSGCRAQIFFRPNDMETATEISNRIGRRKDIWGGDDWAATPQALMSPEYRDDCIIFMPNVRPIRALLYTALHANDSFQQEIAEWKRDFGEEVRRAPRLEQAPVAPDAPDIIPDSAVKPPPDGDANDDEPGEFDDDEEYQREVAEAKRRAEERRRAKNDSGPKPPTFD